MRPIKFSGILRYKQITKPPPEENQPMLISKKKEVNLWILLFKLTTMKMKENEKVEQIFGSC